MPMTPATSMARTTATADDTSMLSLQRPGALLRQLGLDTVYLLLALPMGILTFTVVVTGWSVSLGLAITLVGLPLAMATIYVSRWLAWLERRRAALVLGEPIPGVYKSPTGGFLSRLKALFSDPSTWKDLAWHLLLLPVGIADFTIAVTAWSASLGLLTMPAWWWALPENDPTELGVFQVDSWGYAFLAMAIGILLLPLAAALVRGTAAASGALSRIVLGPSHRQLEERVEVLAQTRAGAVDVAAAELQRIERDLHDGAQARLVALALDLGMAEERFDRDPEGARELVEKARGEARLAMGELRDLARGIRPALLSERGLGEAIGALAARTSLPTTVEVDLDGRLPAPVELAAYFTVAEALTNAVKHARARSAKVRLWRENGRLRIEVRDDGLRRRQPQRPRARRPAQAPGRARRHAGHRLAGRRPHRPVCGGPVRVVIAEDLALLREGISRLLNDHGFEVVAAVADGDAFLAAVDEHRPDVCVVDVRLPPGFKDEGVRAALEARRRIEGLPILVLSQYVERTYAAELLSDGRGGVGYLLKDRVAEVRDFVEAVRRVAEGGTALDPEAVSQLLGQRDDGPLDELTPRERDVLGLMAEGRTNVAIAEELVVTEGAVEKHVSNIFMKLGLPPSEHDHRRVLAVLTWMRG